MTGQQSVVMPTIEPKPEPKRDRYGRYLIAGQGYTRVTTIAKTLADEYNLTRWKMRMAVAGVANRPDLLASAQAHNITTDKNTFNELAEKGLEAAKGDAKANLGTALHKILERVDSGEQLDRIDASFHPFIERYLQGMADAGVKINKRRIEQILVNKDHGYAGTTDRIATVPGGQLPVITDLKTGSTLDFSWLEICAQMAAYAHHTHTYSPASGRLNKRVDVDLERALIIHMPSDGDTFDLHWVDLKFGFEVLMDSIAAREHRKAAKKAHWPYDIIEAGTGGDTALRDWITARVQTVAAHSQEAVANLLTLWPADLPRPLPDVPTADQINAADEALTLVEAAHQIPFGPARPGMTIDQVRKPSAAA